VSSGDERRSAPGRAGIIAFAVIAMAALIVEASRVIAARQSDQPVFEEATVVAAGEPIAAEAQVFRSQPGGAAIDPATDARRPAHPRRFATYRALRAYPGAPPRIPHGLTPTEFQTGGCRTCHERGGFSQRFGAYVPLTPHAEMGACLQCHVGDSKLMAIALPSTDPSARCRQCHAPNATRWRDSSLDWKASEWPGIAPATGAPPPIPHSLQFRGNCLSCHAAPSGVEEIRTRHPERANCRQCHVQADVETDAFVRTARPERRADGARGTAP
jgi:cytochrome c-type protein NapB